MLKKAEQVMAWKLPGRPNYLKEILKINKSWKGEVTKINELYIVQMFSN